MWLCLPVDNHHASIPCTGNRYQERQEFIRKVSTRSICEKDVPKENTCNSESAEILTLGCVDDSCFIHSCMLNLVAAIISKDQAAKRFGQGLIAVALRMSGVF
jgi:hypothetical protein